MRTFFQRARRLTARAALVPAAALAFAACDDDPSGPEITEDIIDIAGATADVSTLAAAIEAAELETALRGDGPFTVFAPTNAAFEALPAGEVERLLEAENLAELQALLQFHVVSGAFFAEDLTEGGTLTTLSGGTLTFSLTGGASVNGVDIVQTDIEAANGVIHLIDQVLLPPVQDIATQAAGTGALSSLAAALEASGLDDTLGGTGPFTVFAPVNQAFTDLGDGVAAALLEPGNGALLEKILTYHVVSGAAVYAGELTDGQTVTTVQGETLAIGVDGAQVTVNGNPVVTRNIRASNGVIHLIDAVLVPEVDVVEKAVLTAATQTLAAAVAAGDLVATLQGDGPFTVFAPVNAAFEALGDHTLEALLDPANQALLQEILTYHVVPGAVLAGDLTDGGTATTVEGRDLTFDLSNPTDPKVNGVSISATDIQVSNGVIHLVEGVLVPELDIVETATITEETETLTAAVAAGDLVTTLKGTGPFTVFAPVNEAFAALGTYSLEALLDPENQAILQDVLTYHVVPGAVMAGDLSDGATATTAEGGELTFDLSDPEDPKVNGASIIATDIPAENGVIHLIDGVLLESLDIVERAIITEPTSTLVDAVVAGDLVTTLQGDGPFTVFAPINEAFEALGTDRLEVLLAPENQALLQKILTYHVVPGAVYSTDLSNGTVTTVEGSDVTIDVSGDAPTVNGAAVIAADIQTENGVIHLIDGVLTENLDLVDVATVEGFSTLVELVDQQGLTATLRSDNGGNGFTVFAPTNAAFEALASVPMGQALTEVLLYHVVAATVESGDLTDGQVVTSANTNGDTFTVNIDGSEVTITDGSGNTVTVVLTDVPAANGVIHVIDGVILPGS